VSTTLGGILSFVKLTVFVLFWGHWLGCIFHFIAMQEDPEDNWLVTFKLYDRDWLERYVNSLYWAVTTMCTVGYGDISPQTPIERLFGVLLLLIACGVFAFTMNSIGAALQQLDQKKTENRYQLFLNKRHRLSNVNNYMKKA
jgi:hyperpolarization activated cyclic nucleotide-gated potassium channel 2